MDPDAAVSATKVLKDGIGRSTFPIEVWIDGTSLVRRMRTAYKIDLNDEKGSFDLTMEMPEYGKQPAPVLPPDSEVFDASGLVGAATTGG